MNNLTVDDTDDMMRMEVGFNINLKWPGGNRVAGA